ncbi:MAG TPA: glycosyltransferase [Nitrospira sp.]|nr:glycosyltransferase [Nitrospira sp.]
MEQEVSSIQICPCYVDLTRETGGVANIVRQICLHLARRGQHVLLLCGNREMGRAQAEPGIRHIDRFLSMEVFDQHLHPLLGPTTAVTKRILSLHGKSIAHVHTCFSAFTEAAMAACHRKHIPFIFTPHGKFSEHSVARYHWAKDLWWRLKAGKAIRDARTIAVSSADEVLAMELYGLSQPWRVIPNGYEAPPAEPCKERGIIPQPYVLFLGYLDPRKQPEFLVEAFSRSEARCSHRLVFAGPDTYGHQTAVQRRAQELGMDHVVFFGPAYGEKKWSLLYHAACLCLPSLGEGLPLVLCEALGAAVPSIFSRACNFREIAARGAGVMLDEFDSSQWARAIDRVCLDRECNRLMRAAARSLQPEYTWSEIVKRWMDLYEHVASASSPHSVDRDKDRAAYG